jgi:hypothetical protein
MYLSEAPSHRTVSKFHYCAYGPAVTQTLIKTHIRTCNLIHMTVQITIDSIQELQATKRSVLDLTSFKEVTISDCIFSYDLNT